MTKILYIGNRLLEHGRTPTGVDTLSPKLMALGHEVVTSSSLKNKWLRLADMLLSIVWHRSKTDLVLIDTYSTQNFYYAFFCGVLCRWLRLPFYPILHGGNLYNRLEKSPKMSRLLFENATKNIAPSLYMLDLFTKNGYHHTLHIPNDINLADYPFKTRKTVAAKLLWVRSFKDIYHPQMAIEVAHALKEKGLEVSLCMVGPAVDETFQECEARAQALHLDVRFTGRLTKPQWTALSQEYDIFINTTHADNLPVSVLEAMALGLPVVSTQVGGIPFLIRHEQNGLLCPDGDVEYMSQQIIRLIDHPDLALQISQAGRLTAEAYDWECIKKKWEELLG
jgi:glycosyltransferase involved in cell wall biosynthesis